MRAKTVNEVKKKKKAKLIKDGSMADPTMPIVIPKNNIKIFKLMQRSIGLKPFNKGAALKEKK